MTQLDSSFKELFFARDVAITPLLRLPYTTYNKTQKNFCSDVFAKIDTPNTPVQGIVNFHPSSRVFFPSSCSASSLQSRVDDRWMDVVRELKFARYSGTLRHVHIHIEPRGHLQNSLCHEKKITGLPQV